MKQSVYIFCILSLALHPGRADSIQNIAAHFAALPAEEKVLANLPNGKETEVINALVKSNAHATLLRLNHTDTIESRIIPFVNSEGKQRGFSRIIVESASPYIIDELAPLLYKSEVPIARYWSAEGLSDLGPGYLGVELIKELIIRAPEFNDEVKSWAAQELGSLRPNVIQSARAWWELNQAALLTNQFDKVQVPATYPAGVPPEEPAQQLAAPPAAIEPTLEPPAPVAPPPEPTPEPVKSSVAASIPTPAAAPAPAAKKNPVWWIVGLIILAAGAAFMARMKKPKV